MPIIEEILGKVGLKYDQLTTDEQETLHTWVGSVETAKMSSAKIKEYVQSMKRSVALELSDSKLGKKEDMFLKARLRNYILLEAFLETPEKAQEALDRTVAGLVSSKK